MHSLPVLIRARRTHTPRIRTGARTLLQWMQQNEINIRFTHILAHQGEFCAARRSSAQESHRAIIERVKVLAELCGRLADAGCAPWLSCLHEARPGFRVAQARSLS